MQNITEIATQLVKADAARLMEDTANANRRANADFLIRMKPHRIMSYLMTLSDAEFERVWSSRTVEDDRHDTQKFAEDCALNGCD
jgi:hypothetical protein